jgi:hypothetical protein
MPMPTTSLAKTFYLFPAAQNSSTELLPAHSERETINEKAANSGRLTYQWGECPREDLNLEPTDYACHYGFRRALNFRTLWSGLSLRFTRLPLSLYTFLAYARLGSGLPSGFRRLGFPEFDRFYKHT